jgi:hypothetical protein
MLGFTIVILFFLPSTTTNFVKQVLFKMWLSFGCLLEVQKEQETTDQIMNKLFENPKFRNSVEKAFRALK